MKKLIPLLLTALFFASCEKEPDLSKVQNDYVVYTQYDKNANFSKGNTFYIADSVLVIGNKDSGATYLSANDGNFIIDTYVNQMQSRGYTQVMDKNAATFGLLVSYVESTYYFLDSSSWWSDYPWYWSPSYWWPWLDSYWYHPYPFIYSYTAGSLITEMVDITSITQQTTSAKPSIIWNSYISDIKTPTTNKNKLIKAIELTYTQSPYLRYK